MKFFIEVAQAASIPRWYGFCWYLPARRAAVMCPVPFNVFFNVIRRGYLVIAARCKGDILERAFEEGRRQGERETLSRLNDQV